MKLIQTAILALIFVTAYSQNWDEIEIIPHKITDQIYMLEGGGGNIGLCIGDDGIVMIDDQFAPLSEKIKLAIKNLSESKINYLINTHWHGDHTGGNENFANDGAIIIAHDNVKERMSKDNVKPFGRTTPASPFGAWPKLTFNDKMNVYFNGQSIQLMHVHNAHTDGDAFVYFPEANVLHMGDCFFKDRFPFIDVNSGGSPDGAILAVEMAMMIADDKTTIIPGHGGLADKVDLLKYHSMLQTMRDRIQSEISAGVTEENLNIETLCEGYETWGKGFINPEKMVKTLFSAYSKL